MPRKIRILQGLAVLLIDMHAKCLDTPEKLAIIPNQIEILKFCRENGIPVFVIGYKEDGLMHPDLRQEIRKLSRNQCQRIYKYNESALCGTDLKQRLVTLKATDIVPMGIHGNACIYDTAFEAIVEEFKVLIAEDLIAEYSPNVACNDFKQWYKDNCIFYEKYNCLLKDLTNNISKHISIQNAAYRKNQKDTVRLLWH